MRSLGYKWDPIYGPCKVWMPTGTTTAEHNSADTDRKAGHRMASLLQRFAAELREQDNVVAHMFRLAGRRPR